MLTLKTFWWDLLCNLTLRNFRGGNRLPLLTKIALHCTLAKGDKIIWERPSLPLVWTKSQKISNFFSWNLPYHSSFSGKSSPTFDVNLARNVCPLMILIIVYQYALCIIVQSVALLALLWSPPGSQSKPLFNLFGGGGGRELNHVRIFRWIKSIMRKHVVVMRTICQAGASQSQNVDMCHSGSTFQPGGKN